jgi:hypothetical protein
MLRLLLLCNLNINYLNPMPFLFPTQANACYSVRAEHMIIMLKWPSHLFSGRLVYVIVCSLFAVHLDSTLICCDLFMLRWIIKLLQSTYEAAMLAAGSTIEVVEQVVNKKVSIV